MVAPSYEDHHRCLICKSPPFGRKELALIANFRVSTSGMSMDQLNAKYVWQRA